MPAWRQLELPHRQKEPCIAAQKTEPLRDRPMYPTKTVQAKFGIVAAVRSRDDIGLGEIIAFEEEGFA